MHLTRIQAKDFRCLREVDFSPVQGVNVIQGGNAQGKTSVLEAVLFAATSKSHRTNNERELAAWDAEAFQVAIEAARADREVTVAANWWRGVKRFRVNGVVQERISDVLGRVQVVFFSPEDIALVKGNASLRRRFLDMEISQVSPPYLASLQQFRQILRQRNELVRMSRPDETLLDVWDAQLAQQGNVLMQGRREYVEALAGHAARAYEAIAGDETLELAYQPDVREGQHFEDVLARARQTDLRNGVTTRGPQRDDVALSISGRQARGFASQGQQRTAALALKLAELALVHERVGEYPVFMLDEVLAELDEGRAKRLLDAIPLEVQCILTTTERAAYPDWQRPLKCFEISGGAMR